MSRIALAAFAGLFIPALAHAHAHLRTASPADGATVHAAPADVAIDFTSAVEPRFSSIEIRDPSNAKVDTGPAETAPGDAKHLSVSVKALPPGTYKVFWKATATDTHKTEGSYSFTVAP